MTDRETRKSGEIRKLGEEETAVGMGWIYSEGLPRHLKGLKAKVQPKIKNSCSFFLPLVLLNHLDCSGVRCSVLETSAVEMSGFSLI